jgi:hypothetical protein
MLVANILELFRYLSFLSVYNLTTLSVSSLHRLKIFVKTLVKRKKKGKAIPVTGRGGPFGL